MVGLAEPAEKILKKNVAASLDDLPFVCRFSELRHSIQMLFELRLHDCSIFKRCSKSWELTTVVGI